MNYQNKKVCMPWYTIILLEISSREIIIIKCKDMCTNLFLAALLMAVKIDRQSKCPLLGGWKNISGMPYDGVLSRHQKMGLDLYVQRWKGVHNILLNWYKRVPVEWRVLPYFSQKQKPLLLFLSSPPSIYTYTNTNFSRCQVDYFFSSDWWWGSKDEAKLC